jgi:chromosome segregation ATPase
MSDYENRRADLEERISDLEETLARLKTQLKAENEREQHDAIDRLEEYLGDLDNKHANLQEFWKVLRDEIKELFSGGSGKTGKDT